MLMWIEFGLVLVSIALAFSFPSLGANWFHRVEDIFARLAQRQKLAVLLVGLGALGAHAAVLPILPVPRPHIHDEFSYLLGADTFAHGRLTNPTHPMWKHFETFHVLMQPTYQSIYPPGQSLVLAFGKMIGGHPFVGVWLSIAVMCASICWMLQGWMPPGWALLGGGLAVIRLGVFSYWANSYWGGAVAATGGALVLGALPRIMKFERGRDALLMGLGLAVLANSRPYEGLVLVLPVALVLFAWLFNKKGAAFWACVRHTVAPLTLIVALAAIATGYYCWRVTGDPFRTPHQLDDATREVAPLFLWQSLRPQPVYRHEAMREFYVGESSTYNDERSISGMLGNLVIEGVGLLIFFLGSVLLLPLVMVMATAPHGHTWARLRRETRFLLLVCFACLAGFAGEVYFQPHYAAPLTCVILAIVLMAMRHLRRWQWHEKPIGTFLVRAVPVICLLVFLLCVSVAPLRSTPNWPTPYGIADERIQAALKQSLGNHLVIVRFKPHSDVIPGWVYNEADIDKSKVVRAWDMGSVQNQELIDYFKGRHVWLLETGESPKLSPYPEPVIN
jgi:hypothetical protein